MSDSPEAVSVAMVEAGARAIFQTLAQIALEHRPEETWENVTWESVAEDARDETRRCARAAIEAALASQAPAGAQVTDDEVIEAARTSTEWWAPGHADYDHYIDNCVECQRYALGSFLAHLASQGATAEQPSSSTERKTEHL